MNKPLVLLDVDGALSADAMGSPEHYGYTEHRTGGGRAVLNQQVADRLQTLMNRCELTWASGWNERANEFLCPLLGWPSLEVLDLTEARRQFDAAWYRGERVVMPEHTWKLSAVQAYVGDRPVAWLDDQLGYDVQRWAEQRSEPTLLICIDAGRGISPEQLDGLEQWIGEQVS